MAAAVAPAPNPVAAFAVGAAGLAFFLCEALCVDDFLWADVVSPVCACAFTTEGHAKTVHSRETMKAFCRNPFARLENCLPGII